VDQPDSGRAPNVWLVITSALEWIAVGLIVRSLLRLRSRSDQ